jgi:hypothetical protein
MLVEKPVQWSMLMYLLCRLKVLLLLSMLSTW